VIEMATSNKTIVMWGMQDLLDSSIQSILTSLQGWNVVYVSNEENVEALHTAIKKFSPAILIIRYEKFETNLLLPMQMIQKYPSLKIITIGFENNSMEVHSKQTIDIKHVSDLISVLDI
jgi:hypothetical protein